MRTWLAVLVGMWLLGGALSCAPRMSKTHFDRWAEETEKRKVEEAEAEKAKEKATAEGKTTKTAPKKSKASPPPAPPPDYSSLPPPGETPSITRTSTSRVIAPTEPDDDDVIY